MFIGVTLNTIKGVISFLIVVILANYNGQCRDSGCATTAKHGVSSMSLVKFPKQNSCTNYFEHLFPSPKANTEISPLN